MWDNAIFDEAFDQAGMRELASLDGVVPAVDFMVRFDRPDVIDEANLVHSTDYEIEYTTASAPGLKYHTRLWIGGKLYRVRQEPSVRGDGYWTRALLELLP
ncbi:hypothetical protein L7Q78_11330 [Achromobacter xylosoxidans]|uniref:head-tail joining protein n=1 Tax=Alcaligenes xylosoxydans xylosoxydans TaxID=85698 RepID=UPI001F0569F6|nr:hypothetical protein [Achromobacter xylosoxidans]MCH1990571.1 hypothetical protein [Achromobacter xylosoxidans]MCH1993366.1 hypothetical protein [Achromobacter xylosoxidans]MCH4588460.1 hypothetical protein [Achromobacter xylosoxidans]